MPKLKPIHEQVVVVMGASSGIGRLAARKLAAHGAKVVVSARHVEGLDSLVAEIEAAGGSALAIPADVAEFGDVVAVADGAVAAFGRIDTWVHVAAVTLFAKVEDTTPEEFRQVLHVNLLGQFHGAKAALPHLRSEGRGALIHVTSAEALRAVPFQGAYSASKHGIRAFLDALRVELEHDNVPISVTNIMPVAIDTPFYNKARTKIGTFPIPYGPIDQPEMVVKKILRAAEEPVRTIYAGDSGRLMEIMQTVAPGAVDWILKQTAFDGQKTATPKSADAPDNLFGPISGQARVHGDLKEYSVPVTPATRLQTRTAMRLAAGIGAALLLLIPLRFLRA